MITKYDWGKCSETLKQQHEYEQKRIDEYLNFISKQEEETGINDVDKALDLLFNFWDS